MIWSLLDRKKLGFELQLLYGWLAPEARQKMLQIYAVLKKGVGREGDVTKILIDGANNAQRKFCSFLPT